MQIKGIHWLSKSAAEAEVIVSDGSFECEAYSQPCKSSVGDIVSQPLHAFGIRWVMPHDGDQLGFRKVGPAGLAQRLVARVKGAKDGRISVGLIDLIVDDPLPGGIRDGDLVEIECARIDMW